MFVSRTLAREGWAEYFDAVSRELFNTPVSIEITPVGERSRIAAAQMALQGLAYDHRNDVFEVAAAHGAAGGSSVLRHLVDHPARIEVDSPTLLAPLTIAVNGLDGARTVVRIEREAEFTG
jgi:hypothetical protein